MPRHPPIALKTLDRSHCQCPSARSRRDRRLNQILCGIQFDVIGTKRPASRDRFEGAVRQPIICRRLSVSCDKSRTFRLMKFEQIFSLRCQNRTGGELVARRKPFLRMTRLTVFISTRPPSFRRRKMVEPDGIEPTTSCLQSRRSPS